MIVDLEVASRNEMKQIKEVPPLFTFYQKPKTMTNNWKIILISILFLFGSLSFTACGSGGEQKEDADEKTEKKEKSKELTGYICPMQCEGEKTYEEQQDCPECGMKLKPVDEVLKE